MCLCVSVCVVDLVESEMVQRFDFSKFTPFPFALLFSFMNVKFAKSSHMSSCPSHLVLLTRRVFVFSLVA